MPKTTHTAADFAKIDAATAFIASLFRGKGRYEKLDATSFADATEKAAELSLSARKGGPQPMIYAILESGEQIIVPKDYTPGVAAKAGKPAKRKPAAKPAPKARAKAAQPPGGKRAAALAAAEAGKLPVPPDFSAKTHHRFLGKRTALVLLVEAGDIAGLKAFPINPISSSPKALDKYRNLAVIALEARAKN